MALRVAVLDDYQEAARAFGPWESLGPDAEITCFHDHLDDLDALAARLAPFGAIVAMRERTRFPRALLERLPALRLLVSTGMGTAHIDLPATRELGITVSGTDGGGRGPAELTWALILGLARNLVEEDAAVRDGRWQLGVGSDLAGATLGLLGLGHIGTQVAAIGQAFGMRTIAWSRHLDPTAAAARGVEAVDRNTLFATADVVTVHLRLSDRTRGLVSGADLARMRPTAFLVNTSRGPIVDEAALVTALRAGQIGGAGLDVFDHEPLPLDHPLRSTPRTILTPHIGYVTDASYRTFFREAVEDIAAFVAGAPVRVLNPAD